MRKICALLLAVLLLAVTVSAEASFVADNARLMTITAAKDLEAEFSRYDTDYGFTVAAMTTVSFGDKYPADYAKTAYVEAGYSNDGVLLVISEQEGQWYLYTSGICAKAISDEEAAKMGAELTDALETGDYYGALQAYAESVTPPVIELLQLRDEAAKETQKSNSLFVLLGMVGGLVVGIMVVLTLSAKKKSEEKLAPDAPAKEADAAAVAAEDVPAEKAEEIPEEAAGETEEVLAEAAPAQDSGAAEELSEDVPVQGYEDILDEETAKLLASFMDDVDDVVVQEDEEIPADDKNDLLAKFIEELSAEQELFQKL